METKVNPHDRYKCQCGTHILGKVFEAEKGHCPKCGENMSLMTEDVDLEEKRWNCPKCDSSYPFTREIQECFVCGSYMDAYAPTARHGKDKGMIPFGG